MNNFLFLPPALYPVYDHASDLALHLAEQSPLNLVHVNHLRFNFAFDNIFSNIFRFESFLKQNSLSTLLGDSVIHHFPELSFPPIYNYRSDLKHRAFQAALNTVSSHYKDTSLQPYGRYSRQIRNSYIDYLCYYYFCQQSISSLSDPTLYIFNTRIAPYRAVYDFCLDYHIPFYSYEYPPHGKKRYLLLANQPIHDFPARAAHLSKLALNHPLSLSRKLRFGKQWLAKRSTSRHGFEVNYALAQNNKDIESFLPSDFKNKKVILCINSSEWEWSALPQSRTNIFGSQLLALSWIVQEYLPTDPSLHLVLRFHPSYATKDTRYYSILSAHLLSLNSTQVTIIPPSSPLNTGELAINSHLVLSFYSSLAPELSSMGLPVISLGPSNFQDLQCIPSATSLEEFISLLNTALYNPESLRQDPSRSLLFFFSRSFQGTKPKYLFYDKHQLPRLSNKYCSQPLYSPHLLILSLRVIRIALISIFTFRIFSLKHLRNIRQLFSFNV